MKNIGWIVGASLLSVLAFFIHGQTGLLWSSISASLAVVATFWLFLLWRLFANSETLAPKLLAVGSLLFLGTIIIYSGLFQYEFSNWQYNNLMDIRKTIERGVSKAHTNKPLLQTLRIYHNDETAHNKTLQQIFSEKFESNITTVNGVKRYYDEQNAGDEDESPVIFVKETSGDDSVILIAQSLFVEGRDSLFTNYNGEKGKMEYHVTLTEEGIQYERQN